MENNEETKYNDDSHYKVRCGREYVVKRVDVEYEGKVISNYSISVQKTKDKTKYFFPKKIRFRSDVVLKDGTKILIKDFFEDVMENKRDKSNPIWHLFIKDFDIIEEPNDMNEAILDYQNNLENARIDSERQESEFLTF